MLESTYLRTRRRHTLNLSVTPLKDSVMSLFRHYNPTKVTILKDKTTKQSNGTGFINFKTQQDRDSAVASMNGVILEGRVLYVTPKN